MFPCGRRSSRNTAATGGGTDGSGPANPKDTASKADAGTDVGSSTPVTGEPTVPDPLRKRQSAFLPEEEALMRELGLGRGVDGTSPTPWLKRAAFQVRKVTDKTIMGTEEGGTVQVYARDVTNIRSQQSTLKASIDVPKAPVTIGVDAEYSRTFTRSRKSVGRRVHNRTVSFVSEFDDASDWHGCNPCKTPPPSDKEGHALEGSNKDKLTFEERMCKWILTEIKHVLKVRQMVVDSEDEKKSAHKKGPTSIVEEFAKFFEDRWESLGSEVDQLCLKFINYFHITHYVSAIQLGAVEYKVMENEEYTRKFGSKAQVEVEKVAELDFSTSLEWKQVTRNKTWSQIGVMTEYPKGRIVVHREDEAVIGAQIKPLSKLISHEKLRMSLERALRMFMDSMQDDRGK